MVFKLRRFTLPGQNTHAYSDTQKTHFSWYALNFFYALIDEDKGLKWNRVVTHHGSKSLTKVLVSD